MKNIFLISLISIAFLGCNNRKCIDIVDANGKGLELNIYKISLSKILDDTYHLSYEDGQYIGRSKNGKFCFKSSFFLGDYYRVASTFGVYKTYLFSSTKIPDEIIYKKSDIHLFKINTEKFEDKFSLSKVGLNEMENKK